jgi:hypothetical protein
MHMRSLSSTSCAIVLFSLALSACATTSNAPPTNAPPPSTQSQAGTFDQQSVINAATGVFGKGAEGLGKAVERVFQELGRPNAYITGSEVGGAVGVGLRYGNGMLYHKVEGERPVHWTGPSIGFDVGGDASKTFTLVYNLNDTEDLFHRFPAVEGKLYFVGGFAVSYHRRGNVVVAPIRLGAGLRAGVNVGYLNYTRKRTFIPF